MPKIQLIIPTGCFSSNHVRFSNPQPFRILLQSAAQTRHNGSRRLARLMRPAGQRPSPSGSALNSGQFSDKEMIEAVKLSYKSAGVEPPPDSSFFIVSNPFSGSIMAAELQLSTEENVTTDQILELAKVLATEALKEVYDPFWAKISFFKDYLKLDGAVKIEGMIKATRVCSAFWPYDKACVISRRPTSCHFDEEKKLHHPSEHAIEFPDGYGIYLWHGTSLSDRQFHSPQDLSEKEINEASEERQKAIRDRLAWLRENSS